MTRGDGRRVIFLTDFGFVKPGPEILLWGCICSAYGCGVKSIHDMVGRTKLANHNRVSHGTVLGWLSFL